MSTIQHLAIGTRLAFGFGALTTLGRRVRRSLGQAERARRQRR